VTPKDRETAHRPTGSRANARRIPASAAVVRGKLYYLIALSLHSVRLRRGYHGTTKVACCHQSGHLLTVLMSFRVRAVPARVREEREVHSPLQARACTPLSVIIIQFTKSATINASAIIVGRSRRVHSGITKHLQRDCGRLQCRVAP
jgi:hypothetical protein